VIAKDKRLRVSATIGVKQKAPLARRLRYELGQMKFELAPRNGEQSEFELKAISEGQHRHPFSFVRTKGRPWQLPGPVKSFSFPDQARTYFQNAGFLADLEAAYQKELSNLFYLGPLREFPKRDYLWARSRPTDVGQRGEKAIDAILAATDSKVFRNLKPKTRLRPFQDVVAHWLKGQLSP
jgi:hypothetical protein